MEPRWLLAGEYPGHPNPATARQKVDLLVDAGCAPSSTSATLDDGLAPYRHVTGEAAEARDSDRRHEPGDQAPSGR